MALHVLAYKMTRVMNLMGIPAMKAQETSFALKLTPNMPYPSQMASTDLAFHRARQNDDLTPSRTQTSKTTVGIAINRVSTHPPDKTAVKYDIRKFCFLVIAVINQINRSSIAAFEPLALEHSTAFYLLQSWPLEKATNETEAT